jgi:TonB family protein
MGSVELSNLQEGTESMNHFQLKNAVGCVGRKLVTAGALALVLAMALPARADGRGVKSRISPVYPEIAKRMRVGGMVKLEAAVDAQGKVTEVKELSGNHTLALAAKEALMQWKFVPAPSDTNETVEINFDLGQQ